MPRPHALQITTHAASATLTPAQKRFNTLLKQIDKAREALATWQEGLVPLRQAYAATVVPLEAELVAARRQWVLELDAAIARPGWVGGERRVLQQLLVDNAGALLLAGQEDDAELKALFARHAGTTFEDVQREEALAMKDLAESMSGLDLGDDEGIASAEDLAARIREQAQAEAAAEAAREEARAAGKAGRRKSAARLRREAEQQQATQSLREIWRRLASALHPDREPDEARRAEKTALMQRVNQAYEAQNLLALLELQLQIEQIDEAHILQASDARLKQYNRVLAEQLDELKAELLRAEASACHDFGLEPGFGLDLASLGARVEGLGRMLRGDLAMLQRDRAALQDPVAARRWVKKQKVRLREG